MGKMGKTVALILAVAATVVGCATQSNAKSNGNAELVNNLAYIIRWHGNAQISDEADYLMNLVYEFQTKFPDDEVIRFTSEFLSDFIALGITSVSIDSDVDRAIRTFPVDTGKDNSEQFDDATAETDRIVADIEAWYVRYYAILGQCYQLDDLMRRYGMEYP